MKARKNTISHGEDSQVLRENTLLFEKSMVHYSYTLKPAILCYLDICGGDRVVLIFSVSKICILSNSKKQLENGVE